MQVLARIKQRLSGIRAGFHTPVFGLDIGLKTVNLVVLQMQAGKLHVSAALYTDLPIGAIVGHTIKDITMVAAAIRMLVDQSGVKSKHAVVALPTSEVFIQTVLMDTAYFETDEQTLVQQLLIEIENDVPYALDEIAMDYQVLKSIKGKEQVEVLVIAANRKSVESYQAVLEAASLQADCLDVQQYALVRLCPWLDLKQFGAADSSCLGLLDFGANYAGINVIQGGEVLYSDIQRVSIERTLTLEFITQWAERLLTLFYTSGIYSELDGLLLLGNNFPDDSQFLSQLSQTLKMKIAVVDPFAKMQVDHIEGCSQAYAVSCGLALRGVG